MKVRLLILFVVILVSTGELFAVEDLAVDFTYPSFTGDFYVSGNVSFAPGLVESEENTVIKTDEPDEEVPTKIVILRRWPDSSIMSVEVIFVANASQKRNYVLSYGEDIRRKKVFTKTAVLPTISFSVGGAPKISEKGSIDVGLINVRVDKSSDIYYYWHVIPIVILLALTYYRYRKTEKI